MSLSTLLPDSGRLGTDGRREATGSVTNRLESSAETVGELSTRVRDAASRRATDVAERAVDELLERAVDRSADDLLAASEVGGGGNGAAELGSDDPLDRALENFLRRYGLDGDRLDDRTLDAIRTRLSVAGADADAEDLLEEVLSDRSTSGAESADGTDLPADDPFAEACSRLRARLDGTAERPVDRLLEDLLERDAVVVGHELERALTEELPSLVADLEAELAQMESSGSAPSRARTLDAGSNDDPDDGPAGRGRSMSVRSAVTMAVAATTLLSDGDGVDPAVGELATSLLQVSDGGVPIERVFSELVPLLVRSGAERDRGLDALRSNSAGSLALVGLFVANLAAMTLGAYVSRKRAPPIPNEIRGPNGEPVVTDEQVRTGKKAFQANGLMNQGSVLGNGSYFGVDLTADALESKAEYMREYYARQRGSDSFESLSEGDRAAVERRVERELDADAPKDDVARYSAAEVYAHRRLREAYVDRYYGGSPERGIPQGYVDSPEEAARIADFACWTAWMAHTNRPDSDHSFTNDWPYVPGTGNRPTGQVVVWSTISVVLLIAGGGFGVWAYHSFDVAEPTTDLVDVPSPDSVSVTPSQYAAARYVPVAGALFVAQALVGAYLAHYYVERTGFYGIGEALGIDLVSLLPFSVGRAWHVNLGILWITTLWLAGGLFLPGLFTERDPPWQAEGATALLGALVAITVGAFAGVWLGTRGAFGSPGSGDDGDLWWWLGSEGLEYLEVGRVWKLGLLAGFATWTGLVLRGVRQLDEPATGLGHFVTYAGGSIALMFAASMLYTPETNMAVTEFWRWWVVHMWVEGVFEFFVTAVISAALVSMDLIEKADAERAILFEVFAIMAAGIVGVSHHYWWVGLPDIWVPIGTTFSTLEFVPLVFVLYRSLGEYRSLRAQGEEFPYTLPLLFILGSSVWNFVGGGVLGFFINLPLINYYEHGTYLTVAHAHTATFGAFGLLALGLGTYILRVVTPESAWNPAWFRGAFWLTNIGLTVMTVASLLPVGFLQLQAAYQDGYAAARSLEFYEQDHVQTLLWARTLGDTPMILGALAFTAASVRHLWDARKRRLEAA
ncbi:Nitric-oxide reductase [Haloterrigena turkmenica DSM 5511]|uniref:Nitric-oxide reductase n=1 Tax=Haloterrigena turkmenica (strain ATCC 51198 / DSM 5511 / JCM 9101 / NCIMB 13204 / VKM B-1734 / 4k) TaxID=543526 RepID=D2RXT4_HALTV|nr:cbb3-type cytochrome c oxidase subunit I [Haloterrigena turkmenica]ADB59768.1 Nitric-oxide reductase [Haloterrigena turkmenica DSM 5511]